MYRTLGDIEDRYLVVPPGEGVSLAEIYNVSPATLEGMLPEAGILLRRPHQNDQSNARFRCLARGERLAVKSVAPSGAKCRRGRCALDLARNCERRRRGACGPSRYALRVGRKGIDAASKFVADRLGLEYEVRTPQKCGRTGRPSSSVAQTVRDFTPTAEGTSRVVKENVPGADYDPQTTWGEYGRTVGSFVPGALLGPGGTVAKITKFAVAPGLASEAAGQVTKGTTWEPWARGGAALGTAGGAAWLSRRPSGSAATTQELQAQAIRQKDEAAASLYPFETAPQRPYKLDYPDDAHASRFGRPSVTMDNDKVVAKRLWDATSWADRMCRYQRRRFTRAYMR